MSVSFAHTPSRGAMPIAFGLDGSIDRSRPDRTKRGWMRAPWAVTVGDLIALPILETVAGLAVDLEAVAAARAVALVYDPDPARWPREATLERYAKARFLVEAAGAALIVVTPRHPGWLEDEDEAALPLAVDWDRRFAHTLGLVSPSADEADTVAATYVLNDAGAVVWAEVETDWTARPGLSGLIPALMALKASNKRRAALA